MRPIKFRAWDKGKGEMIEGINVFNSRDHLFEGPEGEDWDKDVELMQYTGLKDKNGKEIYEGDVVRWQSEGQTEVFPVEWNNEGGAWRMSGLYPLDLEQNGEVIGNIYENPELLKQEHAS